MAAPAWADDTVQQPFSWYNWEAEVDAYYSNLGLYINLTDEPIPDLGNQSEDVIYRDLLLRSHKPRFMLLEASVYPMPILGAAIKQNYPDTYDDATFGADFNLVKVLTAGFEEPYALSLFLGNMVTYGSDETGQSKNKGFMGYLFSHGDKHLLNNEVIADNWYEFEWKIKGKIDKTEYNLDWSFRVGGKWHGNELIADAFYFGIRRDQFDFDSAWLSFLENSGVDMFFEFGQELHAPTQQRLLLHKNIPFSNSHSLIVLTTGLIRTSPRRYSFPLEENTDLQLVIAPSFKFE
jgi:hypothetical protein